MKICLPISWNDYKDYDDEKDMNNISHSYFYFIFNNLYNNNMI